MDILTAKKMLPYACKNDDPVLLCSKHGVGKSTVSFDFSEENGYHFEPLFLSHQEVGDLIGIPDTKIVDDEKITYWSKPEWFKRIEKAAFEGKKSVLLLDELNRAHGDVLQTSLQLVLDGQLHDHHLPKGDLKTFIISAINPSAFYNTSELDPALLDRFLKLDVEVSFKSWKIWALIHKVHKEVINFVELHPEFLHWTPEESQDENASEYANCGTSPRSWVKVSGYVTDYLNGELPEEFLFDFIKGKLGEHVGYIFFTYILTKNQICANDIVELLDQLISKCSATYIQYSDSIKDFICDVEGIQKVQIAEQLINKTIEGLEYKYILIYLYSLEMEYVVPILKTIKENNPIVYAKLAEADKVNNKELFTRIINHVK